jgi:hypothetical protein
MGKQEWLKREDWEQFDELFRKVEGTNWYEVRQLALDVLGMVNTEMYHKAVEEKENISTLLQVIQLALSHVTITPKEEKK